jgi:hypothetical protein
MLEKKETTLAALRELLCPASTEKTDKVLKQAGIEAGAKKPITESASKRSKGASAGHGQQMRTTAGISAREGGGVVLARLASAFEAGRAGKVSSARRVFSAPARIGAPK